VLIFSGKISNESPIAQALIGKKVGDKVAIESPAGSYSVEILSVEKTA
jgi:transcription elongation factor GreA